MHNRESVQPDPGILTYNSRNSINTLYTGDPVQPDPGIQTYKSWNSIHVLYTRVSVQPDPGMETYKPGNLEILWTPPGSLFSKIGNVNL